MMISSLIRHLASTMECKGDIPVTIKLGSTYLDVEMIGVDEVEEYALGAYTFPTVLTLEP